MASGLLCQVTAVRFITLPGSASTLLLSGAGDQVPAHSLHGCLLAELSVLPAGARTHGIERGRDGCLLVRGGRWLAVVRADLEEEDCRIRVGVRKELDDWVFWAALLDVRTLAVALLHGQVEELAADVMKCVWCARCDDMRSAGWLRCMRAKATSTSPTLPRTGRFSSASSRRLRRSRRAYRQRTYRVTRGPRCRSHCPLTGFTSRPHPSTAALAGRPHTVCRPCRPWKRKQASESACLWAAATF